MISFLARRASRVFHSLIATLCLPVLLTGCASLPGNSAQPLPLVPDGAIVIAGADVLPMTGADTMPKQTVVVSGNRIQDIRPFVADDLSANGRVIDARGQVLMPGLVDMHVHFAPFIGEAGDPAQRAAAVMLAHGVTTARSMAGAPEHIVLRERIASGALAGPRVYAGSLPLSDQRVSTAEEAQETVRAMKAAGYDFLKSHFISDPAVWQAVKDEANRLGMATAGHVSNAVGLERAIREHQQIEHLDGYIQAMLPEDALERNAEFGQIPPPQILAKIDRAELAQSAIFDLAARSDSYQVPTLSLFEKLLDTSLGVEELRALPELRYVPDEAIEQWAQQRAQLLAQLPLAHASDLSRLRREIVSQLDLHGVPIMAGSDTAQAFHVWGSALHDEIRALAEIIGPDKALQAATSVPARYFRSLPDHGSATGKPADFGTVSVGGRADLLLLSDNPLQDLSALDRPVAVMAEGTFYDRARLDAMLDEASRAAKRVSPTAAAAGPTLFLTRHFEAEEAGKRHLTATGQAQAQLLADALADRDLGALYVTDTLRARQSAAPLAEELDLGVQVYDHTRPDLLLSKIMQEGKSALVVGHSNTAPQIAQMAGVAPDKAAELVEFGTVFAISASGVEQVLLDAGGARAEVGSACPQGLPGDARCGTIEVPENRAASDDRKLQIQYAVLPSTGSATADPLVVIPGGPGLGAVQSGAGIAQLFAGFRENRDIVLMDQRGTGNSNRLACPVPEGREGPLAALEPMDDSFVAQCLAVLTKRADLSQYTTREATLDLEAVRQRLGYERFDFFGMSYGTRPALDYLRLFPDHTGEVVIRAAAPAEMKLPLWAPRDAQRSFDRLVALCEAQADCAARYPDLQDDLRRMFDRLETSPASIGIVNPLTGERGAGTLDADGLRQVMFFMLYIPEFAMQLPPLIDRAAAGDFSPLVQAVTPALVGIVDQVAWGLRWSVICSEDIPQIAANEIGPATANTFMGRIAIDEDLKACATWPGTQVPDDYMGGFDSDSPILVISGALDPIAGHNWGEFLAGMMGKTRHVTVANASHLPALPGCMAKEVRAFYDHGDLARIDEGCAANDEPLKLRVAG